MPEIHSIREMSRQIFADVDPLEATKLLEEVFEEVRQGARDVNIAAYQRFLVQDAVDVGDIVGYMIHSIARSTVEEEDDIDVVWYHPMPYERFVAAFPGVEDAIREYASNHDLVAVSDSMHDRLHDYQSDFADSVLSRLDPSEFRALADAVVLYVEERKSAD